MTSTTHKLINVLFLVSLFGLLPLWTIQHTIAARYLLAGLLLIIVVISNPDWKVFFQKNKILLIFFSYLIIHLVFFSTDFKIALDNFRAGWMKSILFSLLGAGAGLLITKDNPRKLLLYLGLAFSCPLLMHLGFSLLEGLKRGAIPWGYWGVNTFHGDLGYAALHASMFLSVFVLYQARNQYEKAFALFLLSACIASPLIASTRGGTAFVFISLIFVSLVNLAIQFNAKITLHRQLLGLLAILLVLMAVVKMGSVADPANRGWNSLISRLEMGLKGDPLKINCEGIGVLRKALEDEGQVITPEISRALETINDGDGARVMTARAALLLSAANPMGINQSKRAYQIALSNVCNPTILLAHAHVGWIDTALSIGIPGAILYFLVLLNFARLGLRSMQSDEISRPYAVALFTMSTIWIVRAFIDSTQRDHVLEMQLFTIAFLYGFIVSHKNPVVSVRREVTPPG